MSNKMEAEFALHLYKTLQTICGNLPRVAIITPYAQQASLIRRLFSEYLKGRFDMLVEINTVDAFQGRESDIVLFSSVRASGCKSIGFLSDVRRMNVALTRAKFFLFVIARCKTVSMNPYWKELVQHANESNAVIRVPSRRDGQFQSFNKTANRSTCSPSTGKKSQGKKK
jgi:senataxin